VAVHEALALRDDLTSWLTPVGELMRNMSVAAIGGLHKQDAATVL